MLSSNQLQLHNLTVGRAVVQTILRACFGGDAQEEKPNLALSAWAKGAKPAVRNKQAAFQ